MRSLNSIISAAIEAEGSQAKLAERLGVSQQTVSLLLKASRVSAEMAVRLENRLGVPREELRPDLFAPAPKPERSVA